MLKVKQDNNYYLGAYAAMNRQIGRGKIKMYTRHEMLDVVVVDGKARGIIARNLVTGEIERHSAHAVVIGYRGLWKCVLFVNLCHGK
jgi:succinate dehydrogenase / fumarate reductase flavoprotein subunit